MDAVGGGLIVAIAAILWFAYLLPTWLQRRRYAVREGHAIRLQQTLRVLAETAEAPEPVRLEASAREVVTQQRLLQKQQEVPERLPVKQSEPVVKLEQRTVSARVLRRRRGLCAFILFAGILATVLGLLLPVLEGIWLVPLFGGVGTAAACTMLVALARQRPTVTAAVESPSDTQQVPLPVSAPVESHLKKPVSWTPTPLPKPLHLSQGTIAAAAMASVAAAAELRHVHVEERMQQRASVSAEQLPVLRPQPEEVAPVPSRYASMGIITEPEPGISNLDAVLQRRRVAG